jgi:hypothetical protein
MNADIEPQTLSLKCLPLQAHQTSPFAYMMSEICRRCAATMSPNQAYALSEMASISALARCGCSANHSHAEDNAYTLAQRNAPVTRRNRL